MSFDTDAKVDGIGRILAAELSYDDFATVTYRYASSAFIDGSGNQFKARLLSMGNVMRGFGGQRVATGGSTEIILDNADGALDALAGRENMANHAKLRVRLKVFLYSPATPSSLTSKTLGIFTLQAWPRRNNTTIRLELVDDMMGPAGQAARLPTLADWQAVGDATRNPLFDGFGRPDVLDGEGSCQVQLAFGEDWVQAMPHLIPIGAVDAAYQDKVIVPVCCTTDSGGVLSHDVTNLRIWWMDPNLMQPRLVDVPRTYVVPETGAVSTVWTVERSPAITKGGKTFYVIYLVVAANLGAGNVTNNYLTGYAAPPSGQDGTVVASPTYDSSQFKLEWQGGYPPTAIYKMRGYANNDPTRGQYASTTAGVMAWFVKGYPLSARTQTSAPEQHSVDVIRDLFAYYSGAPSVSIDTTSAARIKASNRFSACTGVVAPWTSREGNFELAYQTLSMRQVVSQLTKSGDLDVFFNWAGDVAFASNSVRDFTTATHGANLTTLSEEHCFGDIEEWLPGEGERYATFNRLFFANGKAYFPENRPLPYQGPFDWAVGSTGVDISDRVIEFTLDQGWRPYRQQAQSPFYWRCFDVAARPMVRFRTDLRALKLDLGDYFKFSWTRGPSISGPYLSTIFYVDQLTYDPSTDTVEVTAVWQDDSATDFGYLLDDESLLVRPRALMSGAALPTPADVTCNFGGTINLTTMGVVAGDILVLRDTAEAADAFLSNATFRITSVNSTTQVSVTPAFDGAINTSIANADWYIERGATTYPSAVSDPSNYPSGGDMYGKVTSGTTYSNSSAGNKLLAG